MTAIAGSGERELVLAYKAGDSNAFDAIVRRTHRPLMAHAVRALRDHAAAEDAVQETFLRAYRALHRFNGDYHLSGWLHRILANVCHDEGRRRSLEGQAQARYGLLDLDQVAPIDDGIDIEHVRQRIRRAMASLPDTYREALELREVEGLEYDQVALRAGVTEQNARARVSRARAKLRDSLQGMLAGVPLLGITFRKAERMAAEAAVRAGTTAPELLSTAVHAAPAKAPAVSAAATALMVAAASVAVPVTASVAPEVLRRPVTPTPAVVVPPAAVATTAAAAPSAPVAVEVVRSVQAPPAAPVTDAAAADTVAPEAEAAEPAAPSNPADDPGAPVAVAIPTPIAVDEPTEPLSTDPTEPATGEAPVAATPVPEMVISEPGAPTAASGRGSFVVDLGPPAPLVYDFIGPVAVQDAGTPTDAFANIRVDRRHDGTLSGVLRFGDISDRQILELDLAKVATTTYGTVFVHRYDGYATWLHDPDAAPVRIVAELNVATGGTSLIVTIG